MTGQRLKWVFIVVCIPILYAAVYSRYQDSVHAYLGEVRPSMTPKVFAPGMISLEDVSEFSSVFNKQGTELFYGVDLNGRTEIRYTQWSKGKWTNPIPLVSDTLVSFNDPFLSPEEDRLYFISNFSNEGAFPKSDYDIFYIDRDQEGWSTNIHDVGPYINSERDEYYMSFDKQGRMYYASNFNAPVERRHDFDIYVSGHRNNSFMHAIPLEDNINTDAYEADVFIAPDSSYLIFCSIRESGFGMGDLYISFKDAHGKWTNPINMGSEINTEFHELCPFVTKDGKFLFYTSHQDIYWVDADIIEKIRVGLKRNLK